MQPLFLTSQSKFHSALLYISEPGSAPWKGHSRAVQPKRELCSPSEDCAPKKLTGSSYWSAIRGLRLLKCWLSYHPKISEQELFFRRFCNENHLFLWFHPRIYEILRSFQDDELFFACFLVFISDFLEFGDEQLFFDPHFRIQRH